MFAVLPSTPMTFGAGAGGNNTAHQGPAQAAHAASSPTGPSSYFYRPAISSPLSSSPIRASSASPPHSSMRDIQSSPIPAQPKFKYASRPARPNPVVQRREVAQESRRKLFLKNVRQRAEDQRWERRGGDQELFKLEWFSLKRDFQTRKETDIDGFVSEAEIEDAAWLIAGNPMPQEEARGGSDEMMVDAIAQEEAAELEALISSMEQDQSQNERTPPRSPQLSDDEDYDAIFEELLSRGQELRVDSSGDTEMS
ncbi:uncharacterized protein E0L32_007137 [Thyridium curvatum]|uniref:Uncharacterized protein n=1 Tax=Thyridium curvatum TaxID=1093900 RepID=A0A507B5C3_9PEZI|nr:uncharacterized protein E0L32_007137 [Thyridium curvatum]TPX12251.1 hypothetical protein E0L32_007137 [Thyridium curvatum]